MYEGSSEETVLLTTRERTGDRHEMRVLRVKCLVSAREALCYLGRQAHRFGMGKIGLRPGGGGGGHSCRRKEGGGVWEMGTCDRPVQRDQSKSSNDDSPRAPRRFFLPKNFPYDTYLKMISASWGSF